MTTLYKSLYNNHFQNNGNQSKSKILNLTLNDSYSLQDQKLTKISQSSPQFYVNSHQSKDYQIEEIDSPRNTISRIPFSQTNLNHINSTNNYNYNSTQLLSKNSLKYTKSSPDSTNSHKKLNTSIIYSSDEESENISFEDDYDSSDDFYFPVIQHSKSVNNLSTLYNAKPSSASSSTSTSPSTSPGQFDFLKSQSSPSLSGLVKNKKKHTSSHSAKSKPYSSTEKHNHREKKRGRPPKERFGQCAKCETTETPEWRRGPDGETSLCNACGLQYAKQMRKEKETSTIVAIGSLSNILN